MVKCKYCHREGGYSCMNTRDMEDFAIDGDGLCLRELARLGGGEKGLRYIILNRKLKGDKE